MEENFASVASNGDVEIDWELAVLLSMDFDEGDRDDDAMWGKILTAVQRMAFERGYAAGCESTHPRESLLALTMGNA